jgi:hypothetical protein
MSRLMAHQLVAGQGMLALGEALKGLLLHLTHETPLRGERPVPGPGDALAFGVVILTPILKLLGVIALRLPTA